MSNDVDAFLAEVRAELMRARAKFPGDRIMTIALAEEFGELCKAILDEPSANVRKEAVQTAVMACRVAIDGDGSVNEWRRLKGLDPLACSAACPVVAYGNDPESFAPNTLPLIRQADHIAAIAAKDAEIADLQHLHGDCMSKYTALEEQSAGLRELADSEGTRAVEYLRRARRAEAELAARQPAPEAAGDAESLIQAHMEQVRNYGYLRQHAGGDFVSFAVADDLVAKIEAAETSVIASARALAAGEPKP
jgi:hypothetical protein